MNPTEIRLGRKKLYVMPVGDKVYVLVDCDATNGMMRIPFTLNQFERWQNRVIKPFRKFSRKLTGKFIDASVYHYG